MMVDFPPLHKAIPDLLFIIDNNCYKLSYCQNACGGSLLDRTEIALYLITKFSHNSLILVQQLLIII